MKRSVVVAGIAMSAVLALAGCGGGETSGEASGTAEDTTLTVWLMSGSAPDPLVAELNEEFEADHPGVTVDYQVQQWNGIQDKLTTALAGNAPPDVIELGNTQNPKFSADGVLTDLTGNTEDLNGADWLAGLKDPGSWDGKQYGVPFYAGTRLVYYRTDMFAKAGITAPPTSREELLTAIEKLNTAYADTPGFQSLYLPGQSWYTYLSLLWDEGGEVATKDGDTWRNGIDSPAGQASLEFYKQLVDTSKTTAPKDNDEANPQQSTVVAQGNVAMFVGLPWELAGVSDPTAGDPALKDSFGSFAMPSKNAGEAAPGFLGGSNVAVPVNAENQELAVEWIKLLTAEKFQSELAALGTLPNQDAYAGPLDSQPLAAPAREAAKSGRATPADPKWATIEAGQNPLKDMLTAVLTGAATPAEAARTAGEAIDSVLNGG